MGANKRQDYVSHFSNKEAKPYKGVHVSAYLSFSSASSAWFHFCAFLCAPQFPLLHDPFLCRVACTALHAALTQFTCDCASPHAHNPFSFCCTPLLLSLAAPCTSVHNRIFSVHSFLSHMSQTHKPSVAVVAVA